METRQSRWQDWIILFLGIWLFIAPIIGVGAATGLAAWNAYISGALVVILSIWALSSPLKWEEWIISALGLWILIAPFVLQFTTDQAALWNHVVVGILIGADALWAVSEPANKHPA